MATAIKINRGPTVLDIAATDHRCIHSLTGRAPEHKICVNNYDCGTCPFDQMLDDMNQVSPEAAKRSKASILAA